MRDDQQQVDFTKWLYERTAHWISTADSKIAVVVTLNTAMLGGLAASFATTSPPRSAWIYLCVIAAVACIAIAVFCAALAAIPRTTNSRASLIFFAKVAQHSEPDYINLLRSATLADLVDDLSAQIHRNAQIAAEKHSWVRKSLLWSFLAATPFVAAVALMVKT